MKIPSIILITILAISAALNPLDVGQESTVRKADNTQQKEVNQLPSTSITIPHPIYGVTIQSVENSVDNLQPIIDALKNLPYKPTARLVFNRWKKRDERAGEDTKAYKTAAAAIRPHSYVMGELLDSFSLRECDVNCYEDRARRYVAALGNDVDIWEIGNEVNGNWARRDKNSKNPDTIRRDSLEIKEKILRAFKIAKGAGKKTALTLYYNDDGRIGGHCWEREQDKMMDWAKNYVPAEMKGENGLDYVLISYYDDKGHCRDKADNLLQPNWQNDFVELAKEFPHAYIGFGERATQCQDGENSQACVTRKIAYIKTVYKLRVDHPKYIGGHFWWYFKEDMIPYTNELWRALSEVIKEGPRPTL